MATDRRRPWLTIAPWLASVVCWLAIWAVWVASCHHQG